MYTMFFEDLAIHGFPAGEKESGVMAYSVEQEKIPQVHYIHLM